MSIEFAKLIAVYGADTSGFDQSAARVTGTLQKQAGVVDVAFGSFFGNIMSQATAAVLGLGQSAVTSYSDFERLGMAVQSLTAREMLNTGAARSMTDALKAAGPAAQATLQWIQKLAIQSPFTSGSVSAAYRQALAYGFASDEAKKLTQNLIDFAAGSGASEGVMNSIALALGQIKAKGRLAGQEVLQLVNTGLPVLAILAKAFGKSTAEIQKMMEAGLIPADAAIKAISRSIEQDFGGAAARTTHSFSGLLSSLSDIKEIGLREFFTGTFETIQPYLDTFVTTMQDPATLTAIQAWGADLGFYVGQAAGAVGGLIGMWQGLGPEAQSAILHMGGLALIIPTLVQVTTLGLQAGAVVMGLGQAASAAWTAWQAGLTINTALAVGFGATALAVGATVVTLAALVAMFVVYNEQITKTQQQGLAANVSAWGQAFEDVTAKGGSAADVLETYRSGINGVNAAHSAWGLTAEAFVNKQDILANGLLEAHKALQTQSSGYDEYKAKTLEAVDAAGLYVNRSGDLVKAYRAEADISAGLIQSKMLLTRSAFEAARGLSAYSPELDKVYKSGTKAADATIDLGKAVIEAKDIFGGLSSALKDAGLGEEEVKRLTDDMKVAMGELSPEMRTMQDDTALLTQAFAENVLTQMEYAAAMAQAKDGTLALSEAEREEYQSNLAMIDGVRAAEDAARDGAVAYVGLAESLKGATNAELAREAIKGLTDAMKTATSGEIPGYLEKIEAMQLQYGFATKQSLALADAMPILTKILGGSILPAENMAAAIAGMNQEASDGVVDWEKFLVKFGATPEEAARVATEIATGTAGAITSGTPAVEAAMNAWPKEAEEKALEMKSAFTNIDWGGVGSSAVGKITEGVLAKIPDLVAAATQAATEAMAAAAGVIESYVPATEGAGAEVFGTGPGAAQGEGVRAMREAAGQGGYYGPGTQTWTNGAEDEGGLHVDMSGSTITFVVQNRQTLEDLMRELRVR